jgi:hypothetical protein
MPGVRHDGKHAGSGSEHEKRQGLVAEVLIIDRRRKIKPGTEVKIFRNRNLLRTAPRFMCSTNPSPSRCLIIGTLPRAQCLG